MTKSLLAAGVALLAVMTVPAFADDENASCTSVPKAEWLSEDAVKTKILAAGYTDIRGIEPMGTCYEIYAKTKDGDKAELYVDPATAAVVRSED